MIEYPESSTISRQLGEELSGRIIENCIRGNSPHKFAWYGLGKDEYEASIAGLKIIGTSHKHSYILVNLSNDRVLVLGEGGETIRLHKDKSTIPAKHQLLLSFDDGRFLTVAVSGWGMASLFTLDEVAKHPYLTKAKADPLDKEFTSSAFKSIIEAEAKNPSLKYFLISEPGISGIGNGMCQEILFDAKLHPKTKIKYLTTHETCNLHKAITGVVSSACQLGGRDTETDIFGNAGLFITKMTSKTVGLPCPNCQSTVERVTWLGGNCYFCPKCQVEKK